MGVRTTERSRGVRDLAEAVVVPLTERQLAERLAKEGYGVVQAHGRYWHRVMPGLYDGIHWLARHTVEEARRPAGFCWGYRAALHQAEVAASNGALPVHLITDVEKYDLAHLPARTRRDLRQFERNDVRIVWLDKPDLLVEQGYEVMMSWIGRVRHREAESKDVYLKKVRTSLSDPSRVVLAGILGDRLLGYEISWIVDGTVYIWDFHVSTDALPLHLSSALWFEAAQVYRRTGLAREICAGLAMPERDGLTDYKNRLGFELVRVPTRVWLLPVFSRYLEARHPAQYYRFTGRGAADASSP